MSLTHEEADELLAAYALGAVEPAEAEAVREHLQSCDECRAVAHDLGIAVENLALAVPTAAPPHDLGARIMAAARDIPVDAPQRPILVGGRLPLRVPRFAGTLLATAAAILLAGWNVSLQHQITDQRTQIAALQNAGGATAAFHGSGSAVMGTLVYLPRQATTFVYLRDLPARTDGRVYELWILFPGRNPQPAGTFMPDNDGSKVVVVPGSMSGAAGMAVSVEPAGGSSAPTTAPFASAGL